MLIITFDNIAGDWDFQNSTLNLTESEGSVISVRGCVNFTGSVLEVQYDPTKFINSTDGGVLYNSSTLFKTESPACFSTFSSVKVLGAKCTLSLTNQYLCDCPRLPSFCIEF